jgi:ribosomal-protein-alanine N-acetyltransferase
MMRVIQLNKANARLANIHASAFDEAWDEAGLNSLIQKSFHYGYALCDDSDIYAFVLVSKIMDEAEILTLATDIKARGKGYASKLMQHLTETLYDQGCKKLLLEVAIDNIAALRLYNRLGFETIGLRKNYYKRPNGLTIDAEIMALNLAQKVAST